MYFMLFPTGHTDEQYARYFGEDDFFGDAETLNAKQRAKLKAKCTWSGVASMLWGAVFAPWLCGFLAAFFLSAEQFRDFVFFLILVKTILIYRSLQMPRHESRAVGYNFKYLLGLYFLYLVVTYFGLTASFDYAASSLETHGVAGMPLAFLRDAYKEFFVNVVVVGLATALFTTKFLRSDDD